MSQLYAEVCTPALKTAAGAVGCWPTGAAEDTTDAAEADTKIQVLIPDKNAPPYIRG